VTALTKVNYQGMWVLSLSNTYSILSVVL